ncbi:MAG: hypothetical protein ABSB13_14365 [Candidatus Binatus sp.]|jgi:hypothetical protein
MESFAQTRSDRIRPESAAAMSAASSAWYPAAVYAGAWLIAAVWLFGRGVGHVAGDLLPQFAQMAVPTFVGCWLRIRLGAEPLAVVGAARSHRSVWRAVLACLAVAAVATPADLGVSLTTLRLSEYFRGAKYGAGQRTLFFGLDRLPFVTAFLLWTSLSEEAIYRLGLLTSLVYTLRISLLAGRACAMELPAHMAVEDRAGARSGVRIWRDPAFWAANLIQAYIFGAVHALVRGRGSSILTVLAAPPTWGGVVLGFLYWRFGIEAAVLTHLFGNLVVIFLL